MTMTITYRGIAGEATFTHQVQVDHGDGAWQPLAQRQDVVNHSPTGLSWGYAGSGPSQLALALLCDAIGEERAKRIYQEFKFRHIADLSPDDDWTLTKKEVVAMVEAIEADQRRGLDAAD